MSKSKNSILLDLIHLPGLIEFLKNHEIIETKVESKYQIFSGKLNNIEIVIYSSGIVLYRGNPNDFHIIEAILFEFLKINQIEISGFQRRSTVSMKIKSGWDETPKSIWLSPSQMESLILHLEKDTDVEKIESELKHEKNNPQKDPEVYKHIHLKSQGC